MSAPGTAAARWENFVSRLLARGTEAFAQAREAALASLEENGYDYWVSQRALIGMEAQLRHDFRQKLEDTWYGQARDTFIAHGEDWHAAESAMLACSDQLADALHAWQTDTEAALAEAYYRHVLAQPLPVLACSQCGAALQAQATHWVAHYIECAQCRSVITYQPSALQLAMPDAVEALARWRVRGLGAQYDAAPDATRLAAYVDAYLDERIALMPALARQREEERARELRRLSAS